MAKGAHLIPEVKKLIAQIYLEHPDYGPTKIHKELLERMKRIGLDKNFGSDWPSMSAVGKVLTDIRKTDNARLPELKGLDSPWSLSSLAEYSIPPEALPTVMSLYKKRLAEDDVLRIRDVLWVARLYKLIDPPDLVWDWASLYALEEMVSEIQGEPFNSSELDLEMISNPYYAREEQRANDIWGIAEKYGADPVKLKALNLSIEETEEIVKSNPEKFIAKGEIQLPRSYSKECAKLADKLTEAQLTEALRVAKNSIKPVKEKKGGKSK